MSIRGVDIASYQGPGYAYPDWAEFTIIKASGGHTYRNEHLEAQVANARQRNMGVGFYHYMFEPSVGGGIAKAEAANFIASVESVCKPGDTLWLDVEELGKAVGFTGYVGDWVVEFCETVGAHFGCVVGVYCATWYLLPAGMQGDARLTKYPLWFASWQDEAPTGAYLLPWDRMAMWQYNADTVDKDLFFGTLEDFKTMGIPDPNMPPAGNEIIPHILDDGRPAVTIVFAGTTDTILGVDVADLGISVLSATEEGVVLDQSVQGNAFGGWRLRATEPTPVPGPPPAPEPAPAPVPTPQPPPEEKPVAQEQQLIRVVTTNGGNGYDRYADESRGAAVLYEDVSNRKVFGYVNGNYWEKPWPDTSAMFGGDRGRPVAYRIQPESGGWYVYTVVYSGDNNSRSEWSVRVA